MVTSVFINHFTETLQEEYKHTNIDFSYLYPMFISTNMTAFSENLSKGSIFTPDVVSFTKQAVNALGTFSKSAGYWSHVLMAESLCILPTWVSIKIAAYRLKNLKLEYEQSHKKER